MKNMAPPETELSPSGTVTHSAVAAPPTDLRDRLRPRTTHAALAAQSGSNTQSDATHAHGDAAALPRRRNRRRRSVAISPAALEAEARSATREQRMSAREQRMSSAVRSRSPSSSPSPERTPNSVRTEAEEAAFKSALRVMDDVYASAVSTTATPHALPAPSVPPETEEPLPTLSAARARRMSAKEERYNTHARSRSPSSSPSPSPPRGRIARGDGGAGDEGGSSSQPQQPQLCPACRLPTDRCPGAALGQPWAPPASCSVCSSPLAEGAVPYPEAGEPAETWTPPGYPLENSISDDDGHPLTWGRVVAAHGWLSQHATCAAAHGTTDASGLRLRLGRRPMPMHLAPSGHRGAGVAYARVCRVAWAHLRLVLGGQLRMRVRL